MSTDGRERLESMWEQMKVWMEGTNWTDADAADRAQQAVDDRGVDAFFDPLPGVPFNEAVSSNYQSFKDEFGLQTEQERDTEIRDFGDRQRRAAINEIESQFQEFGIQAVADAFEERAPPELQQRFDDVFAEFGPDLYGQIAFNELGRVVDEFNSASDMDAELIGRDRVETLREQADAASPAGGDQLRDAERQVLDRLEVAFGQRFDDLDDAVESLRDRIDALQGLDVRTGDVRLRGNRDAPPSVATEINFGQFESQVREQVDRAIDRDVLVDLPRTFEQRIGSVRVVGEDVQLIDLTPVQLDRELTRAVIDSDELLTRFEIAADTEVAAPPAPEVPQPDGEDFPEPEPEPEPDPEPDPDPAPDDDPLVERAVDAAGESLAAIADEFDTSELFELAAMISRGEVSDASEDVLTRAFQQASGAERDEAAARQDGMGEVQRAVVGVGPGEVGDPQIELDPDPGVESVDDLIDEAEPDREPPDRTRDPRGQPGRGGIDPEDLLDGLSDLFETDDDNGIRTLPGTNRPDPNQTDIDRKLAPRFGNRLFKAQAWVAAEQERIARDFDDPERFWQAFGERVWGNTLTRDEFVDFTV